MYFNRIAGKVRNVKLTQAEQDALDAEIKKQLIASAKKYELENDAGILLALKKEFGFGEKRLKRAMQLILENSRALEQHYEMDKGDGGWIALKLLGDCGYDVEQWYNEYGQEPLIELAENSK